MFRTPVFIASSTSYAKSNVIFPVKVTPIHKVWSWGLRGQGVTLTGAGMFTCLHHILKMSWLEVSLFWFWGFICSRKVSWVVVVVEVVTQ